MKKTWSYHEDGGGEIRKNKFTPPDRLYAYVCMTISRFPKRGRDRERERERGTWRFLEVNGWDRWKKTCRRWRID